MTTSSVNKTAILQRVTLVGALLNLLMGLAKVVLGLVFMSHALLADGLHSLSDLLSDVVVIFLGRIAHSGPDTNHPYGHERFETLGTVILGMVLGGVAGALAFDSIERLFTPQQLAQTSWMTLGITLFSIVGKEWLYHYTLAAGKKIKSDLMIANAWHHRSDSLSSVVVLVALIANYFGISWLDPIAALAVAIMIAKIGWELTWNNLQELTDRALPEEDTHQLIAAMSAEPGIKNVHDLRSRRMGSQYLVDVHFVVGDELSAAEAHHVGVRATQRGRKACSEIRDIVFHIDVSADEAGQQHLPGRYEIMQWLTPMLKEQQLHLLHLKLYYFGQQIRLDLYFPQEQAEVSDALRARLLAEAPEWLKDVRLWLSNSHG
ncbi:cation diffusion facilitator family transporter [Pokkaliibacter sp. CJK22405]|uniref:cation diffusion facilitator family transporter n=1 Tax=Pokkaliibacter sp. CJK22405 TaxID=3384615 RepID=UPI003984B5AC